MIYFTLGSVGGGTRIVGRMDSPALGWPGSFLISGFLMVSVASARCGSQSMPAPEHRHPGLSCSEFSHGKTSVVIKDQQYHGEAEQTGKKNRAKAGGNAGSRLTWRRIGWFAIREMNGHPRASYTSIAAAWITVRMSKGEGSPISSLEEIVRERRRRQRLAHPTAVTQSAGLTVAASPRMERNVPSMRSRAPAL
jgi:hypothetical protein